VGPGGIAARQCNPGDCRDTCELCAKKGLNGTQDLLASHSVTTLARRVTALARPASLKLPPASNRRPRLIIFSLVFLIVGANIASAVTVAGHASASRQQRAPAMQAARPLARSRGRQHPAPRNLSRY
jgi:hypothetical protein